MSLALPSPRLQHPSRTFHLESAGRTDPGRVRPQNEDRYGVFPDVGLFIVADGMGGAAAGEVAAQMTIDVVSKVLDAETARPRGAAPPRGSGLPLLVAAIQRANQHVYRAAQSTPAWHGMGSTVAAVLACGERAAVAHVGDSRVYRLRGEHLALLTEDHSLFHDLVRAGLADPERPEACAYRHVITRVVGGAAGVDVDGRVVEVAPGDTLLLCSDGLSSVVAAEEIAEVLIGSPDLEDAVAKLVTRANGCGGPDNITAVAVRFDASILSHRARA